MLNSVRSSLHFIIHCAASFITYCIEMNFILKCSGSIFDRVEKAEKFIFREVAIVSLLVLK